jgi:hypothetical protein
VGLSYVGLECKRSDSARDKVPVIAQLDWNDRLELEDRVAVAAERTDIEVGKILQRDADQTCDGILGRFGQISG